MSRSGPSCGRCECVIGDIYTCRREGCLNYVRPRAVDPLVTMFGPSREVSTTDKLTDTVPKRGVDGHFKVDPSFVPGMFSIVRKRDLHRGEPCIIVTSVEHARRLARVWGTALVRQMYSVDGMVYLNGDVLCLIRTTNGTGREDVIE